MTLLDAPKYDAVQAARRRNILIGVAVACVALVILGWCFWDWPQEHLVNQFFSAVESGNMPKAFGIWNHDPVWQQHPQKYSTYPYGRFETDWGRGSDWGIIKSHKIIMAKTAGSGVVVAVDVNGSKTPVFLWVERSNKTIGFSPVELSTD